MLIADVLAGAALAVLGVCLVQGSASRLLRDGEGGAPQSRSATLPAGSSVLVVSASVGAGHDAAAWELADRLRRRGVHVDVRDYLQALAPPFPSLLREGYTVSVNRVPWLFEWLFAAIERQGLVHRLVLVVCWTGQRRVLGWTRERPYGAVVSTYPLASQTLGSLRRSGRLQVPVTTYLTDPAVHRSWVHLCVDEHMTVTAGTAAQGSSEYGIPMRAAGPLVPSRFTDAPPVHVVDALRQELGLGSDQHSALLLAGSLGLGDVVGSAQRVLAAGFVPVVLCGRNDAARARVSAVPGAVALGWRQDVHLLLRVVDVVVHNAGGMSFTEALAAGVPAVSYQCIPGHGRANAQALEAAGLAPWAREDADLAAAIRAQAAGGRRPVLFPDPAERIAEALGRPAVVSAEQRRLWRVPLGSRPSGVGAGRAAAAPGARPAVRRRVRAASR